MESISILPALLNRRTWNEDQPLVDSFCHWNQYPLFLEMLTQLNREVLFDSSIHGLGHIERTMCHGAMCAQMEHLSQEDTRLLLLACAYHDVGRQNDSLDNEHGYRSAQQIGQLTGCIGEDLAILQGAVDAHARSDLQLQATVEQYHPSNLNRALTIATLLKDADGLDRVRIWDLDVAYLRRDSSKSRARFAQELYCRYQITSGGVLVPPFVRKWKGLDEYGHPTKAL